MLAFTTGLLGGFGHCMGMCGPIVASYTLRSKDSLRPLPVFFPHLLYNAGRITTYVFIGSLMGFTGTFLGTAGKIAGVQGAVQIFAGIFMIVMGLDITGLLSLTGFIERRNSLILKAVRVVAEGDSLWRYYPLGLLLGFLPCGLAYSIFIGAAGAGGVLQAMLYVFSFGIGTMPALLLFGFIVAYLSNRMRGWLYRSSGVIIIMSGILFIVRGISSHASV